MQAAVLFRTRVVRVLIALSGTVLVGSLTMDAQRTVTLRSFDTVINLETTSENSANVSMGDLDGDGDLDLVLAKGRHTPLLDRVLLNDGRGGFVASDLGPTPDRTYTTALADLDGDGDLDIVVSNDKPDQKLIYLNNGKGQFTVSGTWGVQEWSTRNAAVADLNSDSRIDIIAANRPGPSFVCLNEGAARFSKDCVPIPAESAATIVPADFDKDGFIDLAVPSRDGGQSHIYFSDGKAGFARTLPFGPPDAAARVAAAADFNGDGSVDLVAGDGRTSSMIVYLNNGKGGLTADFRSDDKGTPYAIAAADLNNDRYPDIIVGYTAGPHSIFFNDGTGRKFTHLTFGDLAGSAYGFAVGDINGDKFPDIGLARSDAPNVLYLSGPSGKATPLSPRAIGPGAISNFDGKTIESAFGIGWQASSDAIYGGKSVSTIKLVSGGARRSAGALDVEGEIAPGANSWAGTTFWPAPGMLWPANLSGVTRLSFWAKGDGKTYRVALTSRGTSQVWAERTFVAGTDWREYTYNLSDFAGIDTRRLLYVIFMAGPESGRFAFQLDEVRLH